MRALVLKDFPYSADGVRVVTLPAGQEAEIRDDLYNGLKAAGLIGDVRPAAVAAANKAESQAATFDPSTADADAMRAFLAERGVTPHHKAGLAKLREMAAEVLKG